MIKEDFFLNLSSNLFKVWETELTKRYPGLLNPDFEQNLLNIEVCVSAAQAA